MPLKIAGLVVNWAGKRGRIFPGISSSLFQCFPQRRGEDPWRGSEKWHDPFPGAEWVVESMLNGRGRSAGWVEEALFLLRGGRQGRTVLIGVGFDNPVFFVQPTS